MLIDQTTTALAHSTRRAILRRLSDFPRRATELASGFAIGRPAVCKHARLLSGAGLIRVRAQKNGRERISDPAALSGGQQMREVIEPLEELERIWEAALEAFKKYAEKKK
jgi:DNA-binding transcriptional ArsR family regulator